MTVCSVDDENVDADLVQFFGFCSWVIVHSDGNSREKFTTGIERRTIQSRTQSTATSHTSDETAIGIGHRGGRVPLLGQSVKDLFEGCPGRYGQQFGRHHVVQLGEPVVSGGIGLREHSEGMAILIGHDHDAMSAFVNQTECLADRVRRAECDRCFVDRMAAFDESDDIADDVEWNVLGQHH
jgi:hypothetical protein